MEELIATVELEIKSITNEQNKLQAAIDKQTQKHRVTLDKLNNRKTKLETDLSQVRKLTK